MIISLKELHAIELEEVRCENEIAKADTMYKLKLAIQKLKAGKSIKLKKLPEKVESQEQISE